MPKVEISVFKFREDQDLAEHRISFENILKEAIETYETSRGLPPRAWRWPTAAELRAMAAKEPDPMIELRAHWARVNPGLPRRGFHPHNLRRVR